MCGAIQIYRIGLAVYGDGGLPLVGAGQRNPDDGLADEFVDRFAIEDIAGAVAAAVGVGIEGDNRILALRAF